MIVVFDFSRMKSDVETARNFQAFTVSLPQPRLSSAKMVGTIETTSRLQSLKVVHCPLSLSHNPPHEILSGCLQPYFEAPERYHRIRDALLHDQDRYIEYRLDLKPEEVAGNEELRRAVERIHEGDYLAFLSEIYNEWVAEGGSKVHIYPQN